MIEAVLASSPLIAVLRELSFAHSLDQVTAVVRRAVRQLTFADGATFVLKEGAFCFYADEDAISPLWKGRRFPLQSCISGWAMQERQTAVIPDIYADPRIPADLYRPTFVRSLVMVPVRRDDPIAAIGAYWAARNAPVQEHVVTLEALADAAAMAFANAQLYGDLEGAAARERTSRLQLEAVNRQLQRRNHQLERVLDVLPVGIAIAEDPECRVVRQNPLLAEWLRVAPDANPSKTGPEADTLPFRIFSTGAEVPPTELPMQTAARQGRPVAGQELEVQFADAPSTFLYARATPLFDDRGTRCGAVAAFVDVTDQKRRNAELDRATRLLEAHIENSPLAIIEWAADYRITRWSSEAERMFGWGAQEVTGRFIFEVPLVHEDDIAGVEALMADMLAGRRPRNLHENRNRTKDGRTIHAEWYNSAVTDAEGRLVSVFSQVLDVTDRVLAEQERTRLLHQAETARADAEAANRAKDDFLAVLSHELRSPLQAALGWVTMLRRGQLNETMTRRALDVIANSIEQQRQLVDDMLDLSRIVAGKLPVQRATVDVCRVVQGTLDRLLPVARASGITLEQVLEAAPLFVEGDAARLDQIVTNLISNAIKFSERGGHVQVRCRADGGSAAVVVRDWGQGMSPDALAHVFERYWQAEAGSTRRQGGLGLGLAISEYLARAHGGSIEAESAGTGLGSTFAVRLPLSSATAAPAGDTPVPRLHGRRLLVVDDNVDTTELLEHVLRLAGADVRIARSAADAMTIASLDPPDIVVSDLHMPEADGYDLLDALRAGGINAPALALTGIADPAERQRALSHGFVRHLAKPLDPATLVRQVAEVARETYGAPRVKT